MENKETKTKELITITVSDAVTINQQLSKAKFTDAVNDETIAALMPFKFAISKIDKDFQDFVKATSDAIKDEHFKELENKKDKTKAEEAEFKTLTETLTNKLNKAILEYVLKEESIEKTTVDTTNFYTFCKVNNFEMSFIELLYNKLF